jgi:hypothetical protein
LLLKEEIAMKKSKTSVAVKELMERLSLEEKARANAESTLQMLQKKLEEKRRYIDMIKNPRKYEEPKSFLASEKLAEKKQTSLSPDKLRLIRVKTPVKRKKIRSASRNG